MIALLQPPSVSEPPYFAFILFLGLTVLLIAADLWTGFRGQRRVHIPCAVATLVCFAIAVRYADAVGRYWEIEPLYLDIHLWAAAYPATILALLTAVTGSLHFFHKIGRVGHKRIAFLFILFVLLSVATALLMFQHAERI